MRELTVQEDYYLILLRMTWHSLTKRQRNNIGRADITMYSILEGLAQEPKPPFRTKTPTPTEENFSETHESMTEQIISTYNHPTYYRIDYLKVREDDWGIETWEEIPNTTFSLSRFTNEEEARTRAEEYADTKYVRTRVVKVEA